MEITHIESFLKYFENIRTRTERVLDRVPVEHADWRPEPAAFSFCDIIRHLGAIERWMFAENVSGRPSRYPGHGPELAHGLDDARAYLRTMHAQAMSILAQLTEEDLRRPCTTPGGATLPSWKWLRAMVEHEIHHRGQVYLMLRLLGIDTPPLYGLTSEEVRARSVPPELPRERVEQT